MGFLSAAQHHHYYVREAIRAGVHAPLLAALHVVHQSPMLSDDEVGLGIAPANRVGLAAVSTFPGQVAIAANTVRSLTSRLTAQGWEATALWNEDLGRYTDPFLEVLANGYVPPASDDTAAQLESSDFELLQSMYQAEVQSVHGASGLTGNLGFVDAALLNFVEQLPTHYQGLDYQRHAVLEAVRLWRKLDSAQMAIAALQDDSEESLTTDAAQDRLLLDVISKLGGSYDGYPHQREALLRLVQCWQQLPTRETAIAALQTDDTATVPDTTLDAALMAFVQQLPRHYQGKGEQRNILTDAYRLWHDLGSRTAAIRKLGVDPKGLVEASREDLETSARYLDRNLLQFLRTISLDYAETEPQRMALLKLVERWRGLEKPAQARQSLFEDLRRMERAPALSEDAPPSPIPTPIFARPTAWSLDNLQLTAPIVSGGQLTWSIATQGGIWYPDNLTIVDAIVALAEQLEDVRDRLDRRLHIALWYRPSDVPMTLTTPGNSHETGSAVKLFCEGLTSNQIYWALDPYWPGGLGRLRQFPHLVHLDLGGDRTRWLY
ncbi:MAG: peptidase M15A [Cyanobacteria bacterium J06638_22]